MDDRTLYRSTSAGQTAEREREMERERITYERERRDGGGVYVRAIDEWREPKERRREYILGPRRTI